VSTVPDAIPVPPFTRRLPRDVADRIQATAALGTQRRRMAVLVLAAALFGGLHAAVPAGEAHAMRPADCYGNGVVKDADGQIVHVEDRYLC
jgi:hypothetical protein